jgi:hypothetical protein
MPRELRFGRRAYDEIVHGKPAASAEPC